ncbi:glycosyltransferase family 87 protein [Flavobacterium branchiophilum]|uniref:DUF2029 domain-containing protein n=1 Tax=Flavobacterium branchiophilum TaxID=55197 RepID=A0A2H3KEQ9_9FLAO|nr:glycosyltransferase family 87 protein [Flavobacterium branchiophilum]PDS26835.1 hypothetical protein B0A77_01065 [Flavobacterium branchiophilum]
MIKKLQNSPFFKSQNSIITLWILLSIFAAYKQFQINRINNYLIYKNVYNHTLHQWSLYASYPNEYLDHNHYGPIFSLLIAPFAIMPDQLGCMLWNVFNAVVLVYAIKQLPLNYQKINLMLWICCHEFLTTSLSFQFNPIMTAIIILSFVKIHQEKDFWAAFFIILGAFVKIYGIVGLAFFFFSKNKLKLILSLLFWAIILFILPMFISSKDFIIQTYFEWFDRLIVKNSENASLTSMQDISVMGMIKRVLANPDISTLPILGFGLLLFGLPYLKWKSFSDLQFRLLLLASVLLFTVIFSSGSESPTYIIAFLGVAIWYVVQEKPINTISLFLFIFALLLTSLSPSDLFPKYIKTHYVQPYALKALPCFLIWLKIIVEMMFINKNKPTNYLDN